MAVFFFTDRSLQRNWLARNFQDLAYFIERQIHALGDFFGRRFTSEFLDQMTGGSDQLVDCLDHVDRDTDCPGLIGDCASNCLADPPRRIGAEFVATLVLKLIDGFHQADITFLNQVKELETAVRVLLGDTDDETKIRLDQLGFPALDLILRHVQMLDRIFDLLCRYEGLFGLELSNPSLRSLVDLLNFVKGLLRAACLAFNGKKIFPVATELLESLGTGFTADPKTTLATDDFSFPRPDLNRQLPHPLHHPILQHAMQVDGLHLLHDLIANRIDLLLDLLLFRGIAVGMPRNLIETLERSRDFSDRIQPFERLQDRKSV